jgi:hypothetical protein
MKRWSPFLAGAVVIVQCMAAPVAGAAPLRADHPFVGNWIIDVPGTTCSETYRPRADGTMSVTSAAEETEAVIVVDDKPDARGFYKEVETLVKSNGKPDCQGNTGTLGNSNANYLLFNDAADQYLLCNEPDVLTCVGPARRVKDASR